jgi:tetratricopeptide (TPR) repeat protein
LDKIKEELIYKCDILMAIVTSSALNRKNTQTEINIAKKANKKIISCFHKDANYNIIPLNWKLNNTEQIEFDNSRVSFKTVFINNKNNKGQNTTGRSQKEIDLKLYEDSLHICEKIIESDSENILAWHNKGLCLYNLKKYEEAIKAYDEALKIDSKCTKAWYCKGVCLQRLDKYEEAIQMYYQVTKLDKLHGGMETKRILFSSTWQRREFYTNL